VTGALAELPDLLAAHPAGILRVSVSDAERIDHLADRVADLLPPGAVCQSVSQPALTRATATTIPSDGEADVLTLLAEYAASAHGDPDVVARLTELWSSAVADTEADLTDGAVAALETVLQRAGPDDG
jgi:hypothetical protein